MNGVQKVRTEPTELAPSIRIQAWSRVSRVSCKNTGYLGERVGLKCSSCLTSPNSVSPLTTSSIGSSLSKRLVRNGISNRHVAIAQLRIHDNMSSDDLYDIFYKYGVYRSFGTQFRYTFWSLVFQNFLTSFAFLVP